MNYTKRKHNRYIFAKTLFILYGLSLAIYTIDLNFNTSLSEYNIYLLVPARILILGQIIIWSIRNKLYKGVRYAWVHYNLMRKLRKKLLEANYYIDGVYGNHEVAVLPDIKITFLDKDLIEGEIYIEKIRIDKDLTNLDISAALKNYIAERPRLENDENYQIYEIFDSSQQKTLIFNNTEDFENYSRKVDEDKLFVDKFTEINLQSILITGQTGSGKTVSLYSLILQMLMKDVQHNLYFIDPKNSSMAVLGEKISAGSTAVEEEEIFELLRTMRGILRDRKEELKKHLNTQLDASYIDFNFEPHILIFDEYASFKMLLDAQPKKTRDEVTAILSEIILQGRQLGVFIWIITQMAHHTAMPTTIRENLPLKVVLGASEEQTYRTTFGSGISIPERDFSAGEGLMMGDDIISTSPRIVHFSYLNFDIMDAIDKTDLGSCNDPKSAGNKNSDEPN